MELVTLVYSGGFLLLLLFGNNKPLYNREGINSNNYVQLMVIGTAYKTNIYKGSVKEYFH